METIKNGLKRLATFMPENKLYVGVWLFAVLVIVLFNFQSNKTYKFVGVTDSKEVNINSKHAVVIKSVNVISGQAVKRGQLLVELERQDLTQKINEASHKLEELKAEFKLNSALTLDLQSIKKQKKSKSRKKLAQKDESEALISIQIRSLEDRISFLKKEEEDLYIFSSFDGHVGSVNYKNGESASPFQPILTMHKTTPTFIRGFIHENLSHKIALNKKVSIRALSSKNIATGIIKSVGTRISEFPERFRRTSESKIWGREVVVQLPKDNEYLLGEKVFMTVGGNDQKFDMIKRSLADDTAPVALEPFFNLIPIERGQIKDRKIEPSGLVYIKDLGKHLMISDDNKSDKPLVFLLNRDGQLDSHIISIEGIKSVKDMESISEDSDGSIYISSSMSPSKNGKISKQRRKIYKIKRDGLKLTAVSKIDLYSQLNKLVSTTAHSHLEWVEFLNKRQRKKDNKLKKLKIDIEGLIVRDNNIYLGLRRPLKSSREVVILKISDADSVFAKKALRADQVSIWKSITLPVLRASDRNEGISDMILRDDILYFVTASNKHRNMGRLLKAGEGKSVDAVELVQFQNHKPEGLTLDPIINELIITFDDNKGEELFMATVPLN